MLDAEEAYQQYRDMVYGYLIRLCRDRDLAEELTQETFYQAMKNLKRYEGKSSVGTWLCAIARNQFLRIMRKQSPLPLDDVPEQSVHKAARIAKILHAQALLIAGEPLEDPAAYSELVCTLI